MYFTNLLFICFLAWGYSLAAVSIVSLFSIIMIIPAMQVKFYQQMLIFFISLAIGTLVGDALLHLLPYVSICLKLI